MKVKLLLLIYSLIFSLGEVVFPFKTAYINLNGDINSNSKEYNSTHFMNDYFERLLYTNLQIGNPSQDIKLLFTFDDCGFKIGNAKKCIDNNEYLSYYNRNKSTKFEYTDLYIYHLSEFDGNRGHSAADSMKVYKDLKLKKYENLEKVDFYLGSDTNNSLCGVVGFKLDRYYGYCSNISIINNFKSRNITDNYKWSLIYKSDEEGLLIFGSDMEKIISNYDENNLFSINTRFLGGTYPWAFNIDEIIIGENQGTIIDHEMWVELDNDLYFLVGSIFYEKSINELFFEEFLDKDICSKHLWTSNKYNKKYYVIECNKENFGKEQISKFPSLTFINREKSIKIVFEPIELFTETKYKYFFNVVFPYYGAGLWIFGKIFFKKYPVLFNVDQNIIEIYNNSNKEEDSESDSKSNSFFHKAKTPLTIIFIIVLLVITGIIFYFLGKNLNKIRKKKANEMDDDYDYINKNEINNS